MPRFPDLDSDFVCPFRTGCPYLEGLSTAWVWDRYQKAIGLEAQYEHLLEESAKELAQTQRRVVEVEKERDQFKAQLHALQQSQFQQRRKPSPPAKIGTPIPLKKKRGAPMGHPPWQRSKPTRIDRIVPVPAPSSCPHCQCQGIKSSPEIHEHIQEDIVLEPRTVVTSFQHAQGWCPQCERLVWQSAPGELPGAYIGPVAKATATYLRYQLHVPYRKVSQFFHDFFGLQFVPASAYGFDRQAARRGAPLYADLREKIQALPVAHADETSWRHDGNNYWVWYGGDDNLACFVWDAHRSGESAQKLLGENFGGVLVADGLASYNATHPKDRQSCLAHIHRNVEDLDKELSLLKGSAQDRKARQMCAQVQDLIRRACECAREQKTWRAGKRKKRERAFRRELHRICAHPLSYPRAESFRKRLIGPEQKQFFTFLRHRQVPATNNQAERSLRPVVIMRKVIQGTRSESGLENHSILRSLIETARRQSKGVREFIEDLFTKKTEIAQKALYGDSS
jgi:transposase